VIKLLAAAAALMLPMAGPAVAAGNAECWGDNARQDISCTAVTERLLLSLRHASRADIQKAMGVTGREGMNRLHFVSNYSMGARWGSGDVNFVFADDGRTACIFADLDSPNAVAKSAQFIWNAQTLPAGCSDLPGTRLARCRSVSDAEAIMAMTCDRDDLKATSDLLSGRR